MSRGICLVIEDDEDIAGVISLILKREGFEVKVVHTGVAAVAAARTLDPALITLDLALPDISGLDIAWDLKALTRARLLILTADTVAIKDELQVLAAGASAYLAKPFRSDDLRDAVNRLCPTHP